MELTVEILQARINGLTVAKKEALSKETTKLVAPMLDLEIQKAVKLLNELKNKEAEKKNEQPSPSASASSQANTSNAEPAEGDDTQQSLEQLILRDDTDFDNRGSSNRVEYEEIVKKNFKVIEDYKKFDDMKKAIYRHIRDWVNRKTPPTEAQKKKKRAVLEVEFANIERFVEANAHPDYIEEILYSHYKISFGKLEKPKKGKNAKEIEERNAKMRNTFTLIYDDMMEKYFS